MVSVCLSVHFYIQIFLLTVDKPYLMILQTLLALMRNDIVVLKNYIQYVNSI